MTRSTLTSLMLAAAAVTVLAGCSTPPDGLLHGETFTESGQTTAIGRIAQAQAASGAKSDSMLYDRHFNGTELNALGQAKMDLILKGSPIDQPVKIYFVMAHDDVAGREAAVAAYLDKAGVQAADERFAEGPNPNDTTPAEYNLSGIYTVGKDNYTGQAADGVAGAK